MHNKLCKECAFWRDGYYSKHKSIIPSYLNVLKCKMFELKAMPKKTVFQQITTSEESLSEEFVEPYTRWGEDGRPETLWRSNFRELSGMLFDTKEEATAATLARLKEVYQ